jgi:dTDP-4-amino-4,6-dideoxygalactose transaminase/predicted GNAT family N-acyltransferase
MLSEKQIPLFKVNMNENAGFEVSRVLNSSMITQSSEVENFEEKLKQYFDHPYILTLNSATSGLTLAYKLLDLKQTDKVIATPLTCFATTCAALNNNIEIVWADTDMSTLNIDLVDVKAKLTKNTNVLSFVHWGGTPINIDELNDLKQYTQDTFDHELHVIEDCAHTFGSEWDGKKIGTHGNIAVFSLQAIKHLTTADGGLIFLPNKKMYDRAKLLRWYGIDRERRSLPGSDFRLEPDIIEPGFKYHMNDVNAIIGITNLCTIDEKLAICRSNYDFYNGKLCYLNEIEILKTHDKSLSSPWIYTLKILFNKKAEFIQFMKNKGVMTSQVHARNDNHTCVKHFKSYLPQLDIVESQMVSIPVGWWVTEIDRQYIVDCILEFCSLNKIVVRTIQINELGYYQQLLEETYGYTEQNNSHNFNTKCIKNIHVLLINDKIVCTGKLFKEDKLTTTVGHIEDVITLREHRKCGYGTYMVDTLCKMALKHLKCYKVVLYCSDKYSSFYDKTVMSRSGLHYVAKN